MSERLNSRSPGGRLPGARLLPVLLALAAPLACDGTGGSGEARDDAQVTADEPRAGWSPFRRATEAFRATLETLVEEGDLPGAVAAFVLPDGRVGAASSGQADTEAGSPMNPETRFLAGSVGKTFVAATVLSLALDGSLGLDDPVARHLGKEPWFADLPNGASMTVRHLLTHTSGLSDHVGDPDFASTLLSREDATPYLSPRELVALVLDEEPLFRPGDGWAYTDTGYVLLGLMVETVTGRDYRDVVRERFLEPLDLVRTEPQRARMERLAVGYRDPDDSLGFPARMVQEGALVLDPWTEYTGGGLVSNPQDLVRWGRALYQGRAMEGDYLQELLGSAVPTGQGQGTRYGLGVSIHETALGTTYGHSGWFPGYNTILAYYPDHEMAVSFQTNTDVGVDLGEARDALMSAVLAELGS